MRTLHALLVALVVASPFAVGCAAEEEPSDVADSEEATDEQDVVSGKSVKVSQADAGKTITVKKGQSVILTLPSNATTGYQWKVTRTDRTFGYPAEKYLSSSSAVGGGGAQKFTWKTSSPLPMLGQHAVTLEYRRPWETSGPAAQTFTFTVDIVDPAAPPPSGAVQATEADDGKAVVVAHGKDLTLTLASNPTTGYKWRVTSTDRTFGYPEEEYVGSGTGAVGAGGSQKFTWKTSGPLPMGGTHRVQLAYSRGETGTPAKTFTLIVEIR